MRLTVAGKEVALEPRPLALLAVLLERPGDVVSKEVILDRLWAGRAVTESSLTKCMGRLRAALGDADHAMIRTVHGFGYRLDVEVTDIPPSALASGGSLAAVPVAAPSLARPLLRWPLGVAALAVALCFGLGVSRLHLAVRPSPAPPRAQALYQRGKVDWARRKPDSLSRAVEEFTAALRIDPDYAEAYAGLADCYNLLPEYAAMPPAQAFPLAKAAAERALALAPNLADAHAAYAFALFWGDWNFADGMAEFRRAVMLAPEDAGVHHWYATALDNMAQRPEAIGEIDRALALEPGSPSIQADRGLILAHGGQVAEAKAVLMALAARAQDFVSVHRYLAHVAHLEGDDATFLREWAIHVDQQHDATGQAIVRAAQVGLASNGHEGMQRALLAGRLAAYVGGTVSAADVASSYAELGDLPHAVSYLNMAVDRHDLTAIFVLNGLEWRRFMGDAGMVAVLRRIGLR